ncbi:MAG: hypothetical protein JWO02_1656 [Solirubrobacterales bacterium]|nr:hypothetical protein [Solirubrobacterales bacterium]
MMSSQTDPVPEVTAGSDPQTVAEVAAFQYEWRDVLNNEFVSNPACGLDYYNEPPNVQMFDLMNREMTGSTFIENFMKTATFYASAQMEFIDMRIWAAGDIAFVSMFQHYWGVDKAGNDFDFTFRCSDGLQKLDGKWKIVHEHFSFPVNMETGQAYFDSQT